MPIYKEQRSPLRGLIGRFALCTIIVALLLSGIGLGPAGTALAEGMVDSSSGYTQDQLDALNYLNSVRAKLGLKSVTLNASITKAAQLHAVYYNINNVQASLSAHKETQGNPGFMGVSVYDRMKASGWTSGSRGYASGEVMHYGQTTSTNAMIGWLNTAYHRQIILSPKYTEIGIGLADGTAVVDLGGLGTSLPIDGGIAVYPYDGMKDVEVGFYGHENPNPLSQFGVKSSGYIISATTVNKMTWYEATITDEDGVQIPFNEELRGDTLFLYPKSVLKGFKTYKVSLSYQVDSQSDKLNKTWSFVTGMGPKLISLTPTVKEIVINEGDEQALYAQGYFDNGITDSFSELGYTSSNSAGLSVSSAGIAKGIKAGSYTVSMFSGTIKTQLKIKVLPKLKTKVYMPIDSSKMKDISGNSAQSSIEWAMRSGLMTGYSNGLFKPNASVSEAEFWTMFLRLFKVDYEAYSPAKKVHWADGAYKIAQDRNFPLDGLKIATVKDKPITRKKVAEIMTAADGVNYKADEAIYYALAKNYVQGVTERSIEGYQGNVTLTRAEAAKMLKYVEGKLKELRGAPTSLSPSSELPEFPENELYVKPTTYSDNTFFTQFHADRSLTLEGKFTRHAGKKLTVMVQTGGDSPMQIEDVEVVLGLDGSYSITTGHYDQESLNLYLKTEEAYYFLRVNYDSMNMSEY
ncbi:CAP domain-containing protein [Paenibacillus crassostreae]|uniref:SLH domain-containing protein n=2 Tax=Paenibacillus crassostreae TaxID=1763538 RepID=A0A167EKR0_9BACL|nr:CAP domain-containing protein [Paenibacillus crassostreae]AOZ94947.1 hypothetical protein LPB68_21945 [Paenibacillus crassostreae]OAB75638.1 hypothetical protein PNBC_08235 [Paenibacillus crassostreae]